MDNSPVEKMGEAAPRPASEDGQRRVQQLFGGTGLLVAVFYALADRLVEDVLKLNSASGQLLEVIVMAVVTAMVLWAGVLRPLLREVDRERQATGAHQLQVEALDSPGF